jgi:signal transduction histidine kinase
MAQAELGRWRLRRLGEAILLWAGLWLALRAGYDLIAPLWPATRAELSHDVRDAAVSLTTTVVTAIHLLGRMVPRLGDGVVAPAAPPGLLAWWLVGLRWVAVLVLGAVVWIAADARLVVPEAVPRLWAGAAMLLIWNAALSLAAGRWRVPTLEIAVDVLVLAWLVHHAGGVANPFAVFFVFHAVLAAVVLPPPRARATALAIAAFVLLQTTVEALALPPLPLRGLACGWPWDVAAGVGVAILAAGCGFIVAALVKNLGLAGRSLELERGKLRSIIDCMADAVLYVDPRGRILLRNRAADALWPERACPGTDLRVCHDEDRWQTLLARLADPAPSEAHPLLAIGGRSYEATYARVEDQGGALRGVVMVARDVTERMEQTRMVVLGKLAAGLAHELNNPLASIALFTRQALKATPATTPLADHLGTVLRNADMCTRIVKDLLAQARRRPPERARVEARDLVGDVVRTLEPRAALSGVAIFTHVAPLTAIDGDPDQLRQVLVNLGLNGIEAMPDGGTLTFAVRDESAGVRIDVTDTGVGIPDGRKAEVFRPFFTTKPEGTGLGLDVVRDLVARHGGRVELQSAPGAGSTFSVHLGAEAPRP